MWSDSQRVGNGSALRAGDEGPGHTEHKGHPVIWQGFGVWGACPRFCTSGRHERRLLRLHLAFDPGRTCGATTLCELVPGGFFLGFLLRGVGHAQGLGPGGVEMIAPGNLVVCELRFMRVHVHLVRIDAHAQFVAEKARFQTHGQ